MENRAPSVEPRLRSVRRRGPGRPPGQSAGELRDLYLQAALETFLAKGYAGSSLEAIARTARASKMTLYRLYGGKQELFRRVVDLAIARARSSLQIELDRFRSPRAALRGLITQLHDAFTDPTWLSVQRLVIAESLRFPALAHELLSHERDLMAPVEEFLRDANARGALVIADARAAAYQLAALASGGVRFMIHEPLRSETRKRSWVDAICSFAWNSWRPQPSAANGGPR